MRPKVRNRMCLREGRGGLLTLMGTTGVQRDIQSRRLADIGG